MCKVGLICHWYFCIVTGTKPIGVCQFGNTVLQLEKNLSQRFHCVTNVKCLLSNELFLKYYSCIVANITYISYFKIPPLQQTSNLIKGIEWVADSD